MVDMFSALQESISLTQHLNLTLAENEPGCSKLASGTKSKVGEAARFVGEQAVQLHGGMGMSDEIEYRSLLQADRFHQHPVRRSHLSSPAIRAEN
jgi:alkylation response protein AidB-like acyl-CoA dehydrogenase